jgi:hypothetical protein
MDSDRIRMSSRIVEVPWEKRSEFMERLTAAGHQDIAETLRTQRAFFEAQKPTALAVVENWLVTEDVDSVGPEMMNLRTELMRDTRHPPFDD